LYRELQVYTLKKQFKKKKTTSSTERAVNQTFSHKKNNKKTCQMVSELEVVGGI
jgi:cytoskeletal protein RodZ